MDDSISSQFFSSIFQYGHCESDWTSPQTSGNYFIENIILYSLYLILYRVWWNHLPLVASYIVPHVKCPFLLIEKIESRKNLNSFLQLIEIGGIGLFVCLFSPEFQKNAWCFEMLFHASAYIRLTSRVNYIFQMNSWKNEGARLLLGCDDEKNNRVRIAFTRVESVYKEHIGYSYFTENIT